MKFKRKFLKHPPGPPCFEKSGPPAEKKLDPLPWAFGACPRMGSTPLVSNTSRIVILFSNSGMAKTVIYLWNRLDGYLRQAKKETFWWKPHGLPVQFAHKRCEVYYACIVSWLCKKDNLFVAILFLLLSQNYQTEAQTFIRSFYPQASCRKISSSFHDFWLK